jgi:hypothetical protein
MLRRIALVGLAFALTAAASADDIVTARARMAEALGRMAETGKFTLTTSGEEKIGATIRPLQISTAIEFVTVSGIPTVKVEQIVLRDGVIDHRIAGDGVRLWSWDRAKNEYSSMVYQVEQGEAREDFLRQMLVNFVKWSPREASFNARLIQETFLGTNQSERWSPWTGPSNVTVDDDAGGSTITCDALSGSTASVAYRVTRSGDDVPTYELTNASIYRQEQMSTGWLETNLNMQVYYDALPPDTDYSFVPPTGSKPKAVIRPQTGG